MSDFFQCKLYFFLKCRADKYGTLAYGKIMNEIKGSYSLHSALKKWKLAYKKIFEKSVTGLHNTSDSQNIEKIIVLDVGGWDSAFRNAKYFVKYALVALAQFFKSVNDDPAFSQVKFFILTIPSWKERADENDVYPTERISLLSNAVSAALVSLTIEMLGIFPNVFLLDYYAVSISRSDEMADRHHYLTPLTNGSEISIVGQIGITAAKLLLETMCS